MASREDCWCCPRCTAHPRTRTSLFGGKEKGASSSPAGGEAVSPAHSPGDGALLGTSPGSPPNPALTGGGAAGSDEEQAALERSLALSQLLQDGLYYTALVGINNYPVRLWLSSNCTSTL